MNKKTKKQKTKTNQKTITIKLTTNKINNTKQTILNVL
jgi:hypothetical protein